MGGKSLMKKIFLFFLAVSLSLNANLSVPQIEEMVSKIHKKRAGVELKTLENTHEPFVRLENENNVSTFVIPKIKKHETKLILHAVVNGKAYINDKWFAVDDKILGYELKFIGNKGVVLRNENTIKKLFLQKKKNNIIKIEERY